MGWALTNFLGLYDRGDFDEDDVPDRRIASRLPVRGKSAVAGAFESGWPQCRPASRRHADEEDGGRGALPPPEHLEADTTKAQDLSLSAAQSSLEHIA